MSEPLATYLRDHLAAATHAIELLHGMKDEHTGDALGVFAGRLAPEIQEDRDVLTGLAERMGIGSSPLKETSAWLSEKVSRLKLADHGATNIGTFESLEFLVLGIHGKLALWRALALIAQTDERVKGINFALLVARAETQEASVDRWRLEIASAAFRTSQRSA
jgi:hypothetical protein